MNFSNTVPRNIVLLGSTGSIGINTLKIIKQNTEGFKLKGLAAGKNIELLKAQIKEFSPIAVSVRDKTDCQLLKKEGVKCKVFYGSDGLLELINLDKIDTVVSAITGTIALKATIESIKKGYRICLANKETMVAAGELINQMLRKYSKAEIIPVDSEHSAIFQAINGNPNKLINKIILTASGGPFFKFDINQFKNISLKQALKHPTWKMGEKITIDSATMMNKALEMIEAKYLFGLSEKQIEVLIHPQSIVHSLVEFIDSSILAQLGIPDMKLPILYSFTYPQRCDANLKRLDLSTTGNLEFFKPDLEKFKSLNIARYVLKNQKCSGAIFNASNEVAVESFVNKQIDFEDIFKVVENITLNAKLGDYSTVEEIDAIIEESKKRTKLLIKKEY